MTNMKDQMCLTSFQNTKKKVENMMHTCVHVAKYFVFLYDSHDHCFYAFAFNLHSVNCNFFV